MEQLIAPTSSNERIRSIDMIRGVALLGILLMNIPVFGLNWDFWYPLVTGPRSGINYYSFATIFLFFEGTMRGLFSMLFGAGMVLFMQSKQNAPGQPTVAEYYYRRLLWLVLFGLINAYIFLWIGDILFFYGLCGMLLFPFRKMNPKWLLFIGLLTISFGMVKKQWSYNEMGAMRDAYVEAVIAKKENKELTPEQQGAIGAWEGRERGMKPDTAEVNHNLRQMRSGYLTVFTHLIPQNADAEVSYLYRDTWDLLAMMFIGMALFAWGFFSNRLRTSTYLMWMLVGYGLGIPIAWLIFDEGWMNYHHLGSYVDNWRSSHFIFVEFRRVLLTIGHASLIMLVFRSGVLKWLMRALANVGQMAFSNYLMQSIFCTLFFFGYGFGYFNKLHFYELYFVVGAIWIFQLVFSSIWLKYFRFGPFEWLWRSLTYWKKQPMRK